MAAPGCETVGLRELNVWVTGTLLSALGKDEDSMPERARLFNNLGNRLNALGRREDALAATEEAVVHYRKLSESHPDAFLPDLAGSVSVHGDVLEALGRTAEAKEAAFKAFDILWPFFERYPARWANWVGCMIRDCLERLDDDDPPPTEFFERIALFRAALDDPEREK